MTTHRVEHTGDILATHNFVYADDHVFCLGVDDFGQAERFEFIVQVVAPNSGPLRHRSWRRAQESGSVGELENISGFAGLFKQDAFHSSIGELARFYRSPRFARCECVENMT